MNRQDAFRTAKSIVALRKREAELTADEAREKIYSAIPELAMMDEKITQTGVAATRYAISGDSEESQKKLQLVKELSERKTALLQHNGYSLQDLEPQYSCSLCKDSGIYNNSTCVCVKEEVKKISREEIHSAGPLTLCNFDNFSLEYYSKQSETGGDSPYEIMQENLRDCKEYAQYFGKNSDNLLLFGNAGLGKTHLALSIANEVLEKGYNVIYVSAQTAFSEISSQRFNNSFPLFNNMLHADLLILDDLGTEFVDAYVLSKLYELINGRLDHRPTVYTTNICDDMLLRSRYTEKIASRLLGSCSSIPFIGKDIRLMQPL